MGDFNNAGARGELVDQRIGLGLVGGVQIRVPLVEQIDLGIGVVDDLLKRLADARKDLINAVDLLWSTTSVMGRLEGTGAVSEHVARELGLVGPAARACGLKRDVRLDFPYGIYRMTHVPVATAFHGDVCSRTMIRWQEAQKSMDFIEEQLKQMPGGSHRTGDGAPLSGGKLAVALTEGWRGEICHVAITAADGTFSRYKVVDPSFHNWQGLAMALRDQQISDFPLCNKSFNLSYCGFDL